jgi:uncharacterized membrane protein
LSLEQTESKPGSDQDQASIKKGPSMTESTTQTGLSDNGAGALAYFTFVPAIIFLVMPPYNQSPTVRFHAWQSIFLNVAAFAIWIVLVILGRIPFVGFFAFLIMIAAWLAMFVVWLIVVLKAVNGQKLKLPIIGDLAEGQASK